MKKIFLLFFLICTLYTAKAQLFCDTVMTYSSTIQGNLKPPVLADLYLSIFFLFT